MLWRKPSPCEIQPVIRFALVACLLSSMLTGCDVAPQHARALAPPAIEQPPANLPAALHQRNWTGRLNQGSCVHASVVNLLRWLNEYDLGERWRTTYSDGEYDSRLEERLTAVPIDFISTRNADPRFLDWCSRNRYACLLWWKPSHCCAFMGWVSDSQGNQFAAILDNNYPGKFQYTPREQFVRLWSGYGGYACCILGTPASSIPYRSYEVF